MSNFEIGLWSFPVLLALTFLRIPIGLTMLIVGIGGNYLIRGSWTPILAQFKELAYTTFSSYSFSIVPLFLLMGQFAAMSGMNRSLFKAAETMLGHLRGGVAMAAVGACAGFGAVCGSSMATAATMGQVALPELKRHGYSGALATGTLAAGGTLGILIPPSIVLVIYAILTEQNIAKLFTAAMVPGILAMLSYMAVVFLYVTVAPGSARRRDRATLREVGQAMRNVWHVLVLFAVVIGGIYAGVFTPTEAAAIGAIGTGALALAGGGFRLSQFGEVVRPVGATTAMVFLIAMGAAVYNSFLALSQVPQILAVEVAAMDVSPMLVLTVILVFYIVFGCVMDSLSMILLTVPIFYPIVSHLDFGMSPSDFGLWFGILVLVVVEVGLITPPVGMNLFIINAMSRETPMAETYRGVAPFIAADMVRTVLLVAFPSLSLFVVNMLFN